MPAFARVGLGLLLLAGTAEAQATPATRVWLSGGVAAGASRNVESGVGALGQLAGSRGPHLLALRGLVLSDIGGFPDSGGGDALGEVGALYGRAATAGSARASAAAGVALAYFNECPDGTSTCWAPGVSLAAEAALTAELVGVGVQLFGNLNGRAPYGGLALVLLLGWL